MLLYQKIMNQLLWEIKAKKFPAGSALPCERDLARRFSTSQKTIHNAIRDLAGKGYVASRHGSGNYVLTAFPGIPRTNKLSVVMNYSSRKNCDDFLSRESFMNQLTGINNCTRRHGIATELAGYQENENPENFLRDFPDSSNFLNLFFTMSPPLMKTICEKGGTVLSTFLSIHLNSFLEMYGEQPYVMYDYAPGIADAFAYYRKSGIRSCAFFSQGNMGEQNYPVYLREAEQTGLPLKQFHYRPRYAAEKTLPSKERIAFFQKCLSELPKDTLIISDGAFHIAELILSMQNEKLKILKQFHFCVTGEQTPDLFQGAAIQPDYIALSFQKLAETAAEIMIADIQENIPIPSRTILPAAFKSSRQSYQP